MTLHFCKIEIFKISGHNGHFIFQVAGWGRISEETTNTTLSSVLRKVHAPIIPINECKRIYPKYRIITNDKQICAGAINGQDSCTGDSGGPLIVSKSESTDSTKYLYGIVSFGSRKCGNGKPAVHTNLRYYKDWILKNLRP